jgi:hypothetical protein
MQINTKKLAQSTVVIGFGAALSLIQVPNRVAAVVVTGVEVAIALIESVRRDSAECGEEDRK